MRGAKAFCLSLPQASLDTPSASSPGFNVAPITFAALGRWRTDLPARVRRRGIIKGRARRLMMRNTATLATTSVWRRRGGIGSRARPAALARCNTSSSHCDPRLIIADADLVATIRRAAPRVAECADR